MAATLLLKTEPSKYSFDDLLRDGRAVWDGVANAQALIVLRSAKVGDEALIYHSNEGKAIVGIAKVAKAAYPDPKLGDPKMVVIDLVPVKALAEPVTLAQIKAESGLADLALVRQSRLSCMNVSVGHRRLLRELGVR
ncbi:MAG: EVE domain-containing protein [Gemmatimonadales bacterium]|nr:EVE domain-containing protein [Gemmatimonadales bacterium]MDZ4389840.1 EVE domain-containing protein [Gemmatimonadales bacterium]